MVHSTEYTVFQYTNTFLLFASIHCNRSKLVYKWNVHVYTQVNIHNHGHPTDVNILQLTEIINLNSKATIRRIHCKLNTQPYVRQIHTICCKSCCVTAQQQIKSNQKHHSVTGRGHAVMHTENSNHSPCKINCKAYVVIYNQYHV